MKPRAVILLVHRLLERMPIMIITITVLVRELHLMVMDRKIAAGEGIICDMSHPIFLFTSQNHSFMQSVCLHPHVHQSKHYTHHNSNLCVLGGLLGRPGDLQGRPSSQESSLFLQGAQPSRFLRSRWLNYVG